MVQDREQGRSLFVTELVLLAEGVIDVVKVKFEHFDHVWRLAWGCVKNSVEAENACEDSTLFPVGARLLELLCFVLIQLRVEEKVRLASSCYN